MIFDRTVLIERIKAEIERREKEASTQSAEALVNYRYDRTAYVESCSESWNAFANTIKRRLRSDQPVTKDDIPVQLRTSVWNSRGLAVWDSEEPTPRVADTVALTTLLHLLESSTSTAVSTAELERMGFKMAQLFRSH